MQNFLTVQDLRLREPELVRLKPNDKELEALINRAFHDFCLQLKEDQVSVSKTTEPIYFFENKKITASKSVRLNVGDYNGRVINRFVMEKKIKTNEGDNRILLFGATDPLKPKLIKELNIDNNKLQTFKFHVSYPYYILKIVSNGDLDMNINCYLIESPYDTLIEFLALSYIFESLIKTDDIYIVKADRYKNLYKERFAKLNAEYISGIYGTCETFGILK
jgi:hypothetical protein